VIDHAEGQRQPVPTVVPVDDSIHLRIDVWSVTGNHRTLSDWGGMMALDDEPRALVALLAMALLLYLTAWFAEGPVSEEIVEGTPEAAMRLP
jgi:hypothetical protein